MSLINKIENTASINYGGNTIISLPADTLLLLAPTILKVVDKPIAAIGETLTYTITITNIALGEIKNIPFADAIPKGSTYIADSFMLNGTGVVPTITDDTLHYTIPSIGALATAVIRFQVIAVGGDDESL